MEWKNEHDASCPVTTGRQRLAADLEDARLEKAQRVEDVPAVSARYQALAGAVPEHDLGGDEEAESCTCGAFGCVTVRVAGHLVGLRCDRDADEQEYAQLVGIGCDLGGEMPGVYYPRERVAS